MKFISQKLLIFLFVFSLIPTAKAESPIAEDWLSLWTKCRVAIETGKPLETTGLVDGGFSMKYIFGKTLTEPKNKFKPEFDKVYRIKTTPDSMFLQQKWHKPESRFSIVIQERPFSAHHACNLVLTDETKPITPDEEKILVAAFLAERERLIKAGKHEVRDPNEIFPTNFGVGPKKLNPNGCWVVSGLFIDTREGDKRFFQSPNSEQGMGDIYSVCHKNFSRRLNGSLARYMENLGDRMLRLFSILHPFPFFVIEKPPSHLFMRRFFNPIIR